MERAYLRVELGQIRRNYSSMKARLNPSVRLMPVLKANAYGTGSRAVAQALVKEGATWIGIATVSEALPLIDVEGVQKVALVGSVLPAEIPEAVRLGLVIPISDVEIASLCNKEGEKQGKKVQCQIMVDTGMGRLGIPLRFARDLIPSMFQRQNLVISGIFSHFPHAYADAAFSESQVYSFLSLVKDLKEKNGIIFDDLSIANSSGIMNIPQGCNPPFTMARVGIYLYGTTEPGDPVRCALKQAVSFRSRVISIRNVPWGHSISYSRTWKTSRDSVIATVSAGYADGVPIGISSDPRSGSSRAWVIVRGRKCPIVGRVTMDYIMVDVTECPRASVGDEVILFGGDGLSSQNITFFQEENKQNSKKIDDDEPMSVQDWAELKGSITYEILCSMGPRVKRVYENE